MGNKSNMGFLYFHNAFKHSSMLFYVRSMHSHQIGRACIILPVILMRQSWPSSYNKIIQVECVSSTSNPLSILLLRPKTYHISGHTLTCIFLKLNLSHWNPWKVLFDIQNLSLSSEGETNESFVPFVMEVGIMVLLKAQGERIDPILPYTTV